MKIIAIDVRTAGPRDYEHGIIDIGAVILRDGEFIAEFSRLLAPDPYLSYRPGALAAAGTSLDEMEALGSHSWDVLGLLDDWILSRAVGEPLWAVEAASKQRFLNRGLKRRPGSPTISRMVDVESAHQVARALGARGPNLTGAMSLMREYGVLQPGTNAPCWDSTPALERARWTARLVHEIIARIRTQLVGSAAQDVLSARDPFAGMV